MFVRRICECGTLVRTDDIREKARADVDKYHLTKTPAGLSEWLRENYGYEIRRQTVKDWLHRSKIPSSKRVDGSDGYWESNVRRCSRWHLHDNRNDIIII